MITNPETVYTEESFSTFLNNRIQEIPRTESGAIDFEADRMNFQDRMNAQQRDLPEDMGESIGNHTRAEIGSEDALTGEARSDIEAQSRYSDSLATVTPQPKGMEEEVLDEITGGKGAEAEAELPSLGEGVGEGCLVSVCLVLILLLKVPLKKEVRLLVKNLRELPLKV